MSLKDLIEAGKKKVEDRLRAKEEAERQRRAEWQRRAVANWQSLFGAVMEILPADLLEFVPEEMPERFCGTTDSHFLALKLPGGGEVGFYLFREGDAWARNGDTWRGLRPNRHGVTISVDSEDLSVAVAFAAGAIRHPTDPHLEDSRH